MLYNSAPFLPMAVSFKKFQEEGDEGNGIGLGLRFPLSSKSWAFKVSVLDLERFHEGDPLELEVSYLP